MEYAGAALTAGFGKEMGLKSSQQVRSDELWSPNVQEVVSCDDFFVDELLDFSNEDEFVEEEAEGEEEFKDSFSSVSVSVSVSSQKRHESHENSNQSSSSSAKDDFWSVSSRDFEELEWLSHLVAEPLQEYSPPIPSYVLPDNPKGQKETQPAVEIGVFSLKSFPSKPRSKRGRVSGRFWHFPADMSSSLITSSSSCSSPPLEKPTAKKPKKKPTVEGTGGVQSGRRCSHCGVQKTPQWRAGPMGAKTLCNACGVRFKSGRLFPEYRPACSPTFSSELHSNHHRKVLEMRRKKETGQEYSGGTHPAVPSF